MFNGSCICSLKYQNCACGNLFDKSLADCSLRIKFQNLVSELNDYQVLAAMKKHPEGAVLKHYLRTTFGLSKGEFPHKMVF